MNVLDAIMILGLVGPALLVLDATIGLVDGLRVYWCGVRGSND